VTEAPAGERLAYPLVPEVGWEPAAAFRALRRDEPVTRVELPSGGWGWLVTGYADNRALLADPRLSRAAAARSGAPSARRAALEQDALTTTDPPQHTRLRRLVTGAFSSGRIAALTPEIERITARAAAELRDGGSPADLVALFSRPIPMRVICVLLGLPEADQDWFAERARVYLRATGAAPEEIEAAGRELREYLTGAVARRRAEPTDDLIGALVAAEADGGLTDREIVAFGVTLLMAGFAPVAHQLGGSVFALLHEPGRWAALRADRASLSAAIEELLRYCPMPASGGTIRIATEDLVLGGVEIKAGDAVLPALVSANRDESVFGHADELDLAREPNPHVAFGHGVHRCLGAQLARAELRIALSTLLTEFPGLRLAEPAERIPWQIDGMQRGPAALPVTW
jgi:nocardicin N-oxygenase